MAVALLGGASFTYPLSNSWIIARAQAADFWFIQPVEEALAKRDGIAAEAILQKALREGASEVDVAAYMGEALILRGRYPAAADWLRDEEYGARHRVRGLRNLAQVERLLGNMPAAGAALIKASELAPHNAEISVDLGRWYYSMGHHQQAIKAAKRAVDFFPTDARAAEFQGQIVRDQQGPLAALPWFEGALVEHPHDLGLLGEYAATLGEIGRARAMLSVTRTMLTLDEKNAKAFYLQAVLAARADNTKLARGMLARAENGMSHSPGFLLLSGVLDLRAGYPGTAIDSLQKLADMQQGNVNARELLALALYRAQEYSGLIVRFEPLLVSEDTSPYLLSLLAQSYEVLNQREKAAAIQDRLVRWYALPAEEGAAVHPVSTGSEIGRLLARGRMAMAQEQLQKWLTMVPESAVLNGQAGDLFLMRGEAREALEAYRYAAQVRMTDALLLRQATALNILERKDEAAKMAEDWFRQNPVSIAAARMVLDNALKAGDWERSERLIQHLRRVGGGFSPQLLRMQAEVIEKRGNGQAADNLLMAAYYLQPLDKINAVEWVRALRQNDRGSVYWKELQDKSNLMDRMVSQASS